MFRIIYVQSISDLCCLILLICVQTDVRHSAETGLLWEATFVLLFRCFVHKINEARASRALWKRACLRGIFRSITQPSTVHVQTDTCLAPTQTHTYTNARRRLFPSQTASDGLGLSILNREKTCPQGPVCVCGSTLKCPHLILWYDKWEGSSGCSLWGKSARSTREVVTNVAIADKPTVCRSHSLFRSLRAPTAR